MSSEEIILEIEDTPVTCKKEILVANSDYFKAMLEGNFVERNKERIKLEGVNLNAMNIVLTALEDKSFLVENEDLLPVLQVVCMLQFVGLKNLCLNRITELLSPKTCLEVWHVTEQLDITPLYLKAKAMALKEFLRIRERDNYVFETTLDQICCYLGHIYLETDNELSVFQTAIKWWYENSEQYSENKTKILLKLLSCIDYKNLLDDHLKEIMIYPDIASNSEVTQILSCILSLKNDKFLGDVSEAYQETARSLYNTKCRKSPLVPCVVLNLKQLADMGDRSKKIKISAEEMYILDLKPDIYRTGYFRTIVYYDASSKDFKKLIDVDASKTQKLVGYKLIGYKEFIFLFGGEYMIGRGNWNDNFWVYDTIRERWERKSVLPFVRRHFQTCLVGNNLYIVGGTGMYRLVQENMFWYNYKEDKWSKEKALPCDSRQIKCCNFLNKLFILNSNSKRGFFFNESDQQWNALDIAINDAVIDCQLEHSIFSYKDSLYIKGMNLVEFVIRDNRLIEVSVKRIINVTCDEMEVVACNNIVYTLYKSKIIDDDEDEEYSLEVYDLETDKKEFVFRNVPGDYVIGHGHIVPGVEKEEYIINSVLNLFLFQCCQLVKENIYVNNCFE